MRRPAAVAALGGALAAHVLPWPAPVRAAWCWSVDPPKCSAPAVPGGSCAEGVEIAAGGKCTPVCEGNKVPSGSCEVVCPQSGDGSQSGNCVEDYKSDSLPWWDLCGFGERCLGNPYPLGRPDSARWGMFTCVDPADAKGCRGVSRPVVEEDTCWGSWDCPTIYVVCWYVVVLLLGAALSRAPMESKALRRALWQDFYIGPFPWNAANLLALLAVLLALVLFVGILQGDARSTQMPFLTGLAAGLAMPLPVFFALFRLGAEAVLRMSRERAYRMHIVYGYTALAFTTAHGVVVFQEIEKPLSRIWWVFGLIALVLLWLGVLATPLHQLFPKALSYDSWKLLHWSTLVAFAFAVGHMLDHAAVFGTTRAWIVAAANVVALTVYALQKALVVLAAAGPTAVEAEVLGAPGEQYVAIKMKAARFASAYKPGQWGHLATALSSARHPFTCIVTEARPEHVELIVKVSGSWTSQLAEACARGGGFTAKLEGPYGVPPLPDPGLDATVFVVGGVGVTPALTLVPLALGSGLKQVHLFWSLRSEQLLQRCAPYLRGLAPERTCVRITRGPGSVSAHSDSSVSPLRLSEQSPRELPLAAKFGGRRDVGGWLQEVSASLSRAGARSALLFICGPPQLEEAARAALAGRSARGEVDWHIHAEQFYYMPPIPIKIGRGRQDGGGTATVAVVEPVAVGNSVAA